jgi:hypothetical protein
LGQPLVHTAPAEGQDIRDIKARAEAAEAAYNQLIQSTSWWLTAPLRRLARMFR